jgi:hypothetical protein
MNTMSKRATLAFMVTGCSPRGSRRVATWPCMAALNHQMPLARRGAVWSTRAELTEWFMSDILTLCSAAA